MRKQRIPAGFVRNQLPAIGWAAAIFVGSSIPGKALPDLGFRPQDEIAHILEFGILGFLMLRAFEHTSRSGLRRHAAVWTGICGVGWALMDEVHQLFVPGRFASPYDFMADTAGILVGLGIALWLSRRARSLVGAAEGDEE